MFREVFRGFQKFSEIFQRSSQRPSQSAIFLSELRVVLPLIVLPLKLLQKGSFQKSSFSREFGDSRDSREAPDRGKQRRIRPFSRESREVRDFGDSGDSSGEKTPSVMTPFSGPDL